MNLNVISAIEYTWVGLALIWLIGLIFAKKTVRSQPSGPYLFHIAVATFGFFLLGSNLFQQGWLGMSFVPANYAVQIAGLAATMAGCLFALWARLTLGGNWSSKATVKEGHELIVKGPYALARHPIYTGLLLAAVGTALAVAEWRCILGFVLILLALIVKMSQEERLMMETFPKTYPRYRQRVKAVIPWVI